MFQETCIAPVNIAVIKYWGKRDEELILPINDSLSMTLSTDQMCAKTTASASSSFKENMMWLNGEKISFDDNPRTAKCLEEIKRLASAKVQPRFPLNWKLHICSENNFPTAAGLASSAAGYACLVYTLSCLYGVEDEELTQIARQGSGSACRSLDGGFVYWKKGAKSDGTDSIAFQVIPSSSWPNMRVLILVVNDKKKKTSSTIGMRLCVETSDLVKHRAEKIVPQRINEIVKAIKEKDFSTFAEITMKDSNQFHAVALDTFPPCVYMNDVSHSIADFVHKYNEMAGETKVAYTFDAGPNACLYLPEENVAGVVAALNLAFPNDNSDDVEYIKGIPVKPEKCAAFPFKPIGNNLLKYIIHTKIGDGPKRLDVCDGLLSEAGEPKNI